MKYSVVGKVSAYFITETIEYSIPIESREIVIPSKLGKTAGNYVFIFTITSISYIIIICVLLYQKI